MDESGLHAVEEMKNLDAARAGDSAAFERLVEPHRQSLHAHCYRMLGSTHDADDALQDTLLAAWRGLSGFEGRSSLRSWLYRIATHACFRVSARRKRRRLAGDHGPPRHALDDLGEPITEAMFVEPYPDAALDDTAAPHDPAARYELRESVELAFVASLQTLPATQRAVLILRDVLAFPAADVAATLDTSVASVNSALQRARQTLDRRAEPVSQQATLRALGERGQRELVNAFVTAWERSDVAGIIDLLAEDARFTMPPLPAWFSGRDEIRRFLAERVFATPWRIVPMTANAQLAFACYQRDEAGRFTLGSLTVATLRNGEILELTCFLDPEARRPFAIPQEWTTR